MQQQIRIEDMVHFAVLVENELATYVAFPKENEMHIAIYKSNPTFIEVPYNYRPPYGWIWDGEKFIAPEAE